MEGWCHYSGLYSSLEAEGERSPRGGLGYERTLHPCQSARGKDSAKGVMANGHSRTPKQIADKLLMLHTSLRQLLGLLSLLSLPRACQSSCAKSDGGNRFRPWLPTRAAIVSKGA